MNATFCAVQKIGKDAFAKTEPKRPALTLHTEVSEESYNAAK